MFDMNYKGTISLLDPVSFSSIAYSKITEDEQINLAQTEWARIKKTSELLIVRKQYHKYLTSLIYWQLLTNLKKRIWQENYYDDISQTIASKIVESCYRGKTTDLLAFTLRLQNWVSDHLKLLYQNSYNNFPFEQDQSYLNCWYFSKNNDKLDDLTNGLKIKKVFDYHVEYLSFIRLGKVK